MRTVLVGPTRPHSCLEALKTTYRLETVAHFQAPSAALSFVQAEPDAPDALIADVSGLHDPATDSTLIRLLDTTTRHWPGCRVAVVLSGAQRYLLGQIQHANTRVFQAPDGPVALVAGESTALLVADLAAYLNLPRRRDGQARIVLVVSAKGGVGKTTLVANLATALAVRHGLRVAVVDGDLTRGDLARLLGMTPTATLLDLVADPDPGGIHAVLDHYLVRAGEDAGLPFDADLALLPAPGGAIDGGQPWTNLTTRHAQAILDALGCRFDVVLLDTPPDLQRSSPFPAAVLAGEDLPFLALVVVQPQPMERAGARQALDSLRTRNQPSPPGQASDERGRIVRAVLVNRNRAAGNPAALERVLGVEIVATVPYDPRAATARQATDLVYDFHGRHLSRPAQAYTRLAAQIAGEGTGR
jgi:MinD-like ATPase involved in chromosome partitioning or flagellar assembly